MSAPKRPVRPEADGNTPLDAAKKAYERPTFVREQVFETMALACGKTNPTSGQCKSNKKNS